MTKNILVSVIVAFIDKDKKYLRECLTSIEKSANYAGIPLEFVLIANGTAIDSINYLSSPLKILKNKKNIGFGKAINQAVEHTKGDWCLLSCPDVISDKNTLKNIFKNINKNKLAIIGPKIILSDGSTQRTILSYPTLTNIFLEQSYLYKIFPSLFHSPLSNEKIYKDINYSDAIAAVFWLFNRKLFIKLGGFDKRFFLYFEDVEFCRRIKDAGYKIAYNPVSRVLHLEHKSTLGNTSGSLYFKSLNQYLSKYYDNLYKVSVLTIFISGCLIRLVLWLFAISFIKNGSGKIRAEKKIKFCSDVIREVNIIPSFLYK